MFKKKGDVQDIRVQITGKKLIILYTLFIQLFYEQYSMKV